MTPDCPPVATDLSIADALAILDPFFVALRDEYVAAAANIGRLKRTQLYCAPWVHDSPRHFGACREDGLAIVIAPELAELSTDLVLGILGHELGHALDYLYPGEFAPGPEDRAQRRIRASFDDGQWARWITSWEARDADSVERMADQIAYWATGSSIGYLGPCMLQAFERGAARPQGLR